MQKKQTEAAKRLSLNSYNRAQERKAENILEQEEKKKANDAYRARGELTPYEARQREKFFRRIALKYGTKTDD